MPPTVRPQQRSHFSSISANPTGTPYALPDSLQLFASWTPRKDSSHLAPPEDIQPWPWKPPPLQDPRASVETCSKRPCPCSLSSGPWRSWAFLGRVKSERDLHRLTVPLHPSSPDSGRLHPKEMLLGSSLPLTLDKPFTCLDLSCLICKVGSILLTGLNRKPAQVFAYL